MDILHEVQFTFFIMSRSFLVGMSNFSDKRCTEIQHTHFLYINVLFSKIAFDEKV